MFKTRKYVLHPNYSFHAISFLAFFMYINESNLLSKVFLIKFSRYLSLLSGARACRRCQVVARVSFNPPFLSATRPLLSPYLTNSLSPLIPKFQSIIQTLCKSFRRLKWKEHSLPMARLIKPIHSLSSLHSLNANCCTITPVVKKKHYWSTHMAFWMA